MTNNVTALKYASDAIRNDGQFILSVVPNKPEVIGYASDALRNDDGFAHGAARINPISLLYFDSAILCNPAHGVYLARFLLNK
jgi:hypothetical protein